jgi:hypothetical protein
VEGDYYLYDPVADTMLKLKFKEVHSGVAKMGNFYVSCVDFTDGKTLYDVDFVVVAEGSGFQVVDAIVHGVGDQKRAYSIAK